MQTKLTLRLEDGLIRQAKRYAQRSGKSVSEIVGDLFALLGSGRGGSKDESLTPAVRSLRGVLRKSGLDERDYRRHLEDKHR